AAGKASPPGRAVLDAQLALRGAQERCAVSKPVWLNSSEQPKWALLARRDRADRGAQHPCAASSSALRHALVDELKPWTTSSPPPVSGSDHHLQDAALG
ncbi:hypothetical protein, partial [Streptomyces sp. NBC_01481]|uniref:hypothetical protein n=1 Tax=Streptomyces sp. NBC_01481 TaxID=2975869 RepID=UPI002257D328